MCWKSQVLSRKVSPKQLQTEVLTKEPLVPGCTNIQTFSKRLRRVSHASCMENSEPCPLETTEQRLKERHKFRCLSKLQTGLSSSLPRNKPAIPALPGWALLKHNHSCIPVYILGSIELFHFYKLNHPGRLQLVHLELPENKWHFSQVIIWRFIQISSDTSL